MDAARRRRLEELRREFEVTEKNGHEPLAEVLAESIADYLNKKHGRQVVVRRRITIGGPLISLTLFLVNLLVDVDSLGLLK